MKMSTQKSTRQYTKLNCLVGFLSLVLCAGPLMAEDRDLNRASNTAKEFQVSLGKVDYFLQVLALREKFIKAETPTAQDLRFAESWSCIHFLAKVEGHDFSVDNEFRFTPHTDIPAAVENLINLQNFGVRQIFRKTYDPVTDSYKGLSGYFSLYNQTQHVRVLPNKDLIIERSISGKTTGKYPLFSVIEPNEKVVAYQVCKVTW